MHPPETSPTEHPYYIKSMAMELKMKSRGHITLGELLFVLPVQLCVFELRTWKMRKDYERKFGDLYL